MVIDHVGDVRDVATAFELLDGAQVEDRRELERSELLHVGVGERVRTVGPVQALRPDDMAVGGPVATEIPEVEAAFEGEPAIERQHGVRHEDRW